MNTIRKKTLIIRGLISIISFLTALGLFSLSRNVEGFADLYVQKVYPLWVNTIGRVFGVFPFSAVEFLLYGCVLFLIGSAICGAVRVILHRLAVLEVLGRSVLLITSMVSMLFLLYVLNCGINYSAKTFSQAYELERKGYTLEQLQEACEKLTQEISVLSDKVMRQESGAMAVQKAWDDDAVLAIQRLGEWYPALDHYYPRPKGVTVSEILSYQHLTGIYSPFSIEANYNKDMPAYNIPFTMCHELSHLSGYMQEDEANFIASLCCKVSDSLEFNYSGTLMAWIYCTNELYKVDSTAYKVIYSSLPDLVKADLRSNNEFWNAYRGKVSETAQKVNNTYLKINRQSEGIKTYDKVVDLIVNYWDVFD